MGLIEGMLKLIVQFDWDFKLLFNFLSVLVRFQYDPQQIQG